MRLSFRVPLGMAIFFLLVMLGDASACLWLRGTTIDGQDLTTKEDLTPEDLQGSLTLSSKGRMLNILKRFPDSTDPIDRESNAAVEVLMDGDAPRAVAMLEALEEKHPNRYYTAANLGTAYELSGNDEKALQWILEGIRRNPDSHMKTEWLHARILETKIKLKSDPDWLKSHTITEADFSRLRDLNYKLQTRQRPVDATDLHRSLWIQLSARMLFVKPKDPIVAQLLKELALVEAQTAFLENATSYLHMAQEYGAPSEEIAPMKREWSRIIWWSAASRTTISVLQTVALLAVVLAMLWGVFLLLRRSVRHGH